jgi:hypothetical protein
LTKKASPLSMALRGLFGSGVFALAIAFLPSYSALGLTLAILLTLTASILAAYNVKRDNWWTQVAGSAIWSIELMGAAVRGWDSVVSGFWVWALPIMGAYAAAWVLPIYARELSVKLWREQNAPQTKLGRVIMAIVLSVFPVAGVLGAQVGMYGTRAGHMDSVMLFIAVVASVTSIGLAFTISYQFWPKRPWRQQSIST